jgi:1,4-dihydroxy-2-naphthoate octaprenyltransferase
LGLTKWIKAFRLRTLPLSLSGIIISYYYFEYHNSEKNHLLFALALFTTVLLQVLSNLANDYGDGVKGTDNTNRIGPERGLQSGEISQAQMKIAIGIFILLSLTSGISLIFSAFGTENWLNLLLFFVVGILSIIAAMKYTMGKSAYGYRALGDVFVFLFFGIVGVVGFHLLLVSHLDVEIILLAIIIGSLSTMVLNLNNMRDAVNDKESGKITIPVKLGFEKAKIYHYTLATIVFFSIISFNILVDKGIIWFNLLAFIPIELHLLNVMKIKSYKEFDPELKKVALTTFLFAALNSILLSQC